MKRFATIFALCSMLGGCGAREATNMDRDFGLAQYSMHKQILNPAPVDTTAPTGVQSIDAERMMQTRDKTYTPPDKQSVSKRYEISVDQK